MNFVEIVRGIGNVAFVMALAGTVAYVGDRVGHQVGRRRLSLFGIRPRYTSTIVAIATGMIIALVVTLVAIFASQQVKTAFFKLNSINQQIGELQTRQRDLETKVNTGRLVLPVDTLMVPFYRIIPQSASEAQRLKTIRDYYFFAIKYVNATYPRLGLRPYAIPPDADKKLKGLSNDLTTAAELSQANVMLTVTSDQNLFENDQIHFAINVTQDTRYFQKNQVIAQLVIPGKSGASINIALVQLQNYVSVTTRRLHLPPFLSGIQPVQLIPDAQQMQERISKPGTYLLTAFAAADFYPHLGGIPIVIVLTQRPVTVPAVIGVDPGRSKAGYALVERSGGVLAAGIEPVERLHVRVAELLERGPVEAIALGRGTNARAVRASLAGLGTPIVWVDEYETTRRARELYFIDPPPRGWRRLVPLGLQLPSRPVDDYAAILIARRFLARGAEARPLS